ncbi:MAG: ACT domain-containing protein [Myxococcales bacterium]|nr:ACT domain-containing protein [Myxococcales bacterium]
MESLVLTIIGPDRPGLVQSLSRVIDAHEGSWEQSRMAHLGGQFAGLLRVQVPPERVAELETALGNIGDGGLRVVVERGGADVAPERLGLARLEVVGGDRPGIIRQLSAALAELGVNVEELHTECEGAPWSGEPLFKARARLRVPEHLELEQVRTKLEEIAADLMVDISLQGEKP